jgi:uncharacterized protein YdeI (YjbR/CyaY-like superfamily)
MKEPSSVAVNTKKELPILTFSTPKLWRDWLVKNHHLSAGIWLRFFKKDSGRASVSYDQALDEALCYGWIDCQLKKYDEESWLRKFTPRRPKSVWSNRNKEHIQRLIAEGKMHTSGLKEVDAAKQDGRWAAAYESASTMEVPQDFMDELAKNPPARAFFDTLNKANLYAIAWRLTTAKKPETRQKRLQNIIEKLAKGEKLHG